MPIFVHLSAVGSIFLPHQFSIIRIHQSTVFWYILTPTQMMDSFGISLLVWCICFLHHLFDPLTQSLLRVYGMSISKIRPNTIELADQPYLCEIAPSIDLIPHHLVILRVSHSFYFGCAHPWMIGIPIDAQLAIFLQLLLKPPRFLFVVLYNIYLYINNCNRYLKYHGEIQCILIGLLICTQNLL